MAHEIEIRNGIASMFYADKIPWHGLGQAVEKEVTAAAAIRLAQLDWTCKKQPIYLKGNKDVDGIPVIGTQVPNQAAVVREEDGKILGVVGSRYHIIQNRDCFGFTDELIGSGQAVYHTAAALRGGKVLFLTMKLPSDLKIGDDRIEKYILLTSSHDGTYSLQLRWTPVRVVCANTMSLALATKTGNVQDSIKIRHTINYQAKIQQARDVLQLTNFYYEVMEKEFNKLLDAQFSTNDMTQLAEDLFPAKGTPSTKTKNNRDKLVNLYIGGLGNKSIAGTKWAAINAVTEFADHHAAIRIGKTGNLNESRLNSAVLGGSGAALKQKAYDLLKVA